MADINCIICHEPATNYNRYVYYCACKYDAHDECIEQCKTTNCVICGAKGYKLDNLCCLVIGYAFVSSLCPLLVASYIYFVT